MSTEPENDADRKQQRNKAFKQQRFANMATNSNR
ncbi:unnamed protein product, partial [Rotaria sp. Silwood1]